MIERYSWGWFAVESLEWCHARRDMEGGVIPKRSPRQECVPLLRPLMHKTPQILFEVAINYLGLAVCLQMVGRTHF